MDIDYAALIDNAVKKLADINAKIDVLKDEEAKLLQFIKAILPLVSPDQRKELQAEINQSVSRAAAHGASLVHAIRETLRSKTGEWLTAAEVRDALILRGFDFTAYTSNPLASISTTLKRIAEKEIGFDTRTSSGVAVYRHKGTLKTTKY